jgi:hypothetical protein
VNNDLMIWCPNVGLTIGNAMDIPAFPQIWCASLARGKRLLPALPNLVHKKNWNNGEITVNA